MHSLKVVLRWTSPTSGKIAPPIAVIRKLASSARAWHSSRSSRNRSGIPARHCPGSVARQPLTASARSPSRHARLLVIILLVLLVLVLGRLGAIAARRSPRKILASVMCGPLPAGASGVRRQRHLRAREPRDVGRELVFLRAQLGHFAGQRRLLGFEQRHVPAGAVGLEARLAHNLRGVGLRAGPPRPPPPLPP